MIGKNDRFNRNIALQCSFCGKTQDEVRKLVAGPSVYICDECVDLCVDILSEEFILSLLTFVSSNEYSESVLPSNE